MNSNNSPYLNSYGLDYGNGDTSLERTPYIHTPLGNDVEHLVMSGETIFSIAFKYYGDSGLWYMIADYNLLSNPLVEIVEGLQITIPNGR